MVKIYNVTVPKKYEKDGEEKTMWNTVGRLVHFPATEDKDEGYKLELNMFPDTPFFVFEQKKRDEQRPAVSEGEESQDLDSEIPF